MSSRPNLHTNNGNVAKPQKQQSNSTVNKYQLVATPVSSSAHNFHKNTHTGFASATRPRTNTSSNWNASTRVGAKIPSHSNHFNNTHDTMRQKVNNLIENPSDFTDIN